MDTVELSPPSSSTMDERWLRSRRCESGNCLEVATSHTGHVTVRDSKTIGPVLNLDRAVWRAFMVDVREGRFDRD